MVEIKTDESISGFAAMTRTRADAMKPQPEPEPTPEPVPEPEEPVAVSTPEETPDVAPAAPVTIEEPSGGLQTRSTMTSLEAGLMDPHIIVGALSENPHKMAVTRAIYGDVQIQDAMKRREEGTLQAMREPHKPLPHVAAMMTASGQSADAVGYFITAKGTPRLEVALANRIGPARYEALESAYEEMMEIRKTEGDQGFFGFVGGAAGGVGNFFGRGDFIDAPVAGAVSAFKNLNDMAAGMASFISKIPTGSQRVRLSEGEAAFLAEQGFEGEFKDGKIVKLPRQQWKALNEQRKGAGSQALIEETKENLAKSEEEAWAKVETGLGVFTAAATEYMAAYITTPGFSGGATFMGRAVNGLLKGAVADNVVYEEGDANIARMLEKWGAPGGELLEVLATSEGESDEVFLDRVKITAEGMALGVAIETVGFALLAMRAARKGDPQAATKHYAKALEAEASASGEAATKYVDQLAKDRADLTKQELQIAEGADAAGAVKTRTILEFDYDQIPDWNRMDNGLVRSLDVFARTGTLSGADAKTVRAALGKNWLGDYDIVDGSSIGNIYRIDADKHHEIVASKFLGMLNKIQEPVQMNQFRGMALQVLDTLDEDMVDPHLLDRVRNVDPSQWSTNDAANIFATGMLQDSYVDQLQRLVSDVASNADQLSNTQFLAKMERIDALQAQVAILQAGRAKMGRNASHAMLALKETKKVNTQEAASKAHINWMHSRNMISDRRRVKMLDAAMKLAANKRAKAKVVNQAATKPTTLERLLHVTNANLLFNTSTQSLMLVGNFLRATVRNPMVDVIEGLLINPIEAVLGRADGWQAAGKSLQRAWHTYGMMRRALPEAMRSFGKFWRTGKSQFGDQSMLDDKGFYVNKTLKEVRQSKAEDALDHGMKAAEHVYRFMGSVDEMFKELVISAEMGVRSRTGDYGKELQRIAQLRTITQADFEKYLHTSGHNKAQFAEITNGGRVVDTYAKNQALDTMFQSEAADGSLNKALRDILTRRNEGALLARLLMMRFVTTPLNVMEERIAGFLSPILMTPGRAGPVGRIFAGKFHRDLQATLPDGSPDMRLRSRTRAILMTNNMFMAMGLMSAFGLLRGDGDEGLVDVDPESPTYGNIRLRFGDGTKRYLNVLDAEVPFLNAFVLARMAGEQIKHAEREDVSALVQGFDVLQAVMAMYVNETLEKSSLANMTASLTAITDDKFRGAAGVVASNASAFVPFNWWFSRFADATNEGEFDGRPVSIMERMAKQFGPLKAFGWEAINRERDALGRLLPGQNRGYFPFVSREFQFDDISDELADIKEHSGRDFTAAQFEREDVAYHKIAVDGRSLFDMMQGEIASGGVVIGGQTLEQAASEMINSQAYKDNYQAWLGLLAQRSTTSEGQHILRVGGADVQDPRIKAWRTLLSQYREKARIEILKGLEPDDLRRVEDALTSSEWTDDEKRQVAKELF